jgi:hypothetical protein
VAIPVYSSRLFAARLLVAGAHTLYTVGAGNVVILRDLDVVQAAAFSSELYVYDGSSQVSFAYYSSPANVTYYSWRGRQVFSAGETIKCFVVGSGQWDLIASGYILTA